MIIGITGGVGCGKSAVLDYIESEYGALVIKADEVGHIVMEPKRAAYDHLLELFSKDILAEDGFIDRPKMAAAMFADKALVNKVNEIIHPAVKEYINNLVDECRGKTPNRIIIIEAALLLEGGYREVCERIYYVYANEQVRRSRLKESRSYTDEKIDSIMRSQLTEDEYKRLTDGFIDNSGSFEDTKKQIDELLKGLMA